MNAVFRSCVFPQLTQIREAACPFFHPNYWSFPGKGWVSPFLTDRTEHRGPSGTPRLDQAIFPPFPPHRNRAGTNIALGDRRKEVAGSRYVGALCFVLGALCFVLGAWCLVLGAWWFLNTEH